jgi:hypothetical protein
MLFLPWGVFLAYGCARLLSWPRSIALALLSLGGTIAFAWFMGYLESTHASETVRSDANTAGIEMCLFWGWVLYRIGRKKSYWSPKAQRGWRIAGWVSVAFLFLSILKFILSRLNAS